MSTNHKLYAYRLYLCCLNMHHREGKDLGTVCEKDDCFTGVLVLPCDTRLGPGMTLLYQYQKLRMSRSIALLLVVWQSLTAQEAYLNCSCAGFVCYYKSTAAAKTVFLVTVIKFLVSVQQSVSTDFSRAWTFLSHLCNYNIITSK